MNADAQRRGVSNTLRLIHPNELHMDLLQNPCIPKYALPLLYNMLAYSDAILNPKGMTRTNLLDNIYNPRQPKSALSNFLYYGHERLPPSPFDLMLVAHCRTSCITHHYSHKLRGGKTLPEETSQRYNKGNVSILPQDSIKDSISILFTGSTTVPTRKLLMKNNPVLVTKSIVKTLTDFYMENNSAYQDDGVKYNHTLDTSLLQAVEICHLVDVDTSPSTEDAAGRNNASYDSTTGDLVMDNVGYTCGDRSPASRESMKLHTLAAALDQKPFLVSRTGSTFVSDDDPGLLASLFPHLDPWNIGGFNHEGRCNSSKMLFEYQDCSPFQCDPNFALNTTFRDVASELKAVAPSLTELARKWADDPYSKPTIKILRRLSVAATCLRGSAGYKLTQHNEIRAMMRKYCAPALFITLNPHNISSNILATVGGIKQPHWQQMSAFERARFVTNNPGPAALFLTILVKTGQGHYGTVEAQGRGTLHCHLLALRDRMRSDPVFQQSMFACHLPGQDYVKKPTHPADEMDPRLEQPPQISDLDKGSFAYEFHCFVKRLAIKCNWHAHTDTCYKHLKNGEKRGEGNCRIRIDGHTRNLTEIDPETESIELRRLHLRINNFNDVIIFLLQCNMDVKYIGSGEAAKALVYYSDLQFHHSVKFNGDVNSSAEHKNRNLMTKAVNAMMGKQEISHQQVMSYLVGGGDYYASHTFHNLKFYEFLSALKQDEQSRNRLNENVIVVDPDSDADLRSKIIVSEELQNILSRSAFGSILSG
ncbi:hypothetical protein BV22DRAFT_1108374 [Leucogyrophana mollusca]|uniref:Uncharacterized protein n=1 Tax=Leucogyrophana mollusca TaxID=85980 RepID=A0ACB8AXV7_9AGAM|nr:hypothetical protein BV22DRAFT_1108374 [Leucogyrophana mollusca]